MMSMSSSSVSIAPPPPPPAASNDAGGSVLGSRAAVESCRRDGASAGAAPSSRDRDGCRAAGTEKCRQKNENKGGAPPTPPPPPRSSCRDDDGGEGSGRCRPPSSVAESCCRAGAGGAEDGCCSKSANKSSSCENEIQGDCRSSKIIMATEKSCRESDCGATCGPKQHTPGGGGGNNNESNVGGRCCSSKSTPAIESSCSKGAKQNSCCADEPQDDCCSPDVIPGSANKSCCAVDVSALRSSGKSDTANRDECCDFDGKRSAVRCTSSEEAKSACCGPENSAASCTAKDAKGCCVMTHTCLAVVRPDDSAVDVFDARGRVRTFRNASGRRLCFSSHGAGAGTDGMMTPCLDGDGEHDEADEGCPCGVEEEHIHAHVYDPDVCGAGDDGRGCADGAANRKATDWRFLSRVTLYPDDGGRAAGSRMPVTASMPEECNSGALRGHLAERGLGLSHWLRWRNEGKRNRVCNENEGYCGVSCKSHRLYPVRHGDHTDFLIHNETKGELHMEHPNCVSCGECDIHGRFRHAHTRRWTVDASKSRIELHFFEARDEPFRLLDVLAGLFDLESSRVDALRRMSGASVASIPLEEMMPPSSPSLSRVSRSSFHVEGICCASEIPQVEAILRPMEGLAEVSVNTTTRTVYVDHDVDVTSATEIASALNSQGFGAVVKKDAAVAMDQMAGIPTDVFVSSSFDLAEVLKITSEADRWKIAVVIQACLDEKFSKEQVKNVAVNDGEKMLTLEHNPYYLTASGIADALASHMYDVKIVSDGGADGMWALSLMKENAEDTIEHQASSVRWPVVLSGVFWIISMFSLIGGNWEHLKYVALLSVAFGLPPIAVKAFRTLRRCRFDVNCMMLFAAVGALPLQEYTESAAVTFLFAISEALETRATARARNALASIVSLRPERANAINPVTKDVVVLPASAVAVGALVSVRTGDKVPCDGVVTEGSSAVDESSLTGESRPVNKCPGDRVSGGTINAGNTRLVVRTTATSGNSAVARLIRLIEEAQSNRSDTEKLVDSFARVYTPIVVLTALCMCTIPWAFGTEVGTAWAKNGLITIVIACPCALIISTPVTYVAGLAAAAQKGVIVKGGQHLEGLGRVKSIAFDKTGTLSQGVFALLHFNVVGQTRSRKEVFEYLALMEAPASHPLSDAIVKAAANEQIEIPKLQLENHTLLPGEGITANVAGKDVHVGNKKLLQRLRLYDALAEDVKATAEGWAQLGGTVGFISIEGEGIVGAYCVADKIRDEAKDVVNALKRMGIEITMLTGDQRPAAVGIGAQIGLEERDIKSELLPEDKLTEIGDMVQGSEKGKKCWKAKGSVMMVGDGVNDAPALALADVSVAMGEGAALAMDAADVTLMDSNLDKLLYIVRMGRRVVRTIVENVAFSLIVKAVVMGFTFAGRASLWAAIASDVGAMLIVTLNGMKLLPRASREGNERESGRGPSREVGSV